MAISKVLRRVLLGSICAPMAFMALGDVHAASAKQSVQLISLKERSLSGRSLRAGQGEVVQVMLADGTSLTLSPGANVTINSFNLGSSDGLKLTVSSGNVRVAGGRSNDTAPITIRTPQAVLSLDAGTGFVSTASGQTRAHLLNGKGLTVASGGRSERVYRPGFEVVSSGGAPSAPAKMGSNDVYADLTQLNPGIASKTLPDQVRSVGGAERVASSTPRQRKDGLKARAGGNASTTQAGQPKRRNTSVQVSETAPGAQAPASAAPSEMDTVDVAERRLTAPVPTARPGSSGSTDCPATTEAESESGDAARSADQCIIQVASADLDDTADGNDVQAPGTLRRSSSFSRGLLAGRGFDGSARADINYASAGFVSIVNSTDEILLQNVNDSASDLFPNSYTDAEYRNLYLRPVGPTSNSVSSSGFSQLVLDGAQPLAPLLSVDGRLLQYGFGAVNSASTIPYFFLKDAEFAPGSASTTKNSNNVYAEYVFSKGGPNYFTFPNAEPQLISNLFVAVEDADGDSFNPPQPFTQTGSLFTAGFIVQEEVDQFQQTRDVFRRSLDNFLAASFSGGVSSTNQNVISGADFFFAAGDVDAAAANEVWNANVVSFSNALVNRFYVTPGITAAVVSPPASPSTDGLIRAFGRAETKTGATFYDSGIYVVNPAAGQASFSTPSVLLHADFGGTVDGNGRLVASTISSTMGGVQYRRVSNGGTQIGADAFATAHTIGSTSRSGAASSVFGGDIRSTAAGGGNPAIGAQSGRAGYMVLENYAASYPVTAAEGAGAPFSYGALNGGEEDALGDNIAAAKYALLRMASAVTTGREDYAEQRDIGRLLNDDGTSFAGRVEGAGTLSGFAAGLVEVESGGTVGLRNFSSIDDAAARGANLTGLSVNRSLSTISGAQLRYDGGAVPMRLGGSGDSAYVTDQKFAFQTTGANKKTGGTSTLPQDMSFVSGGLVKDGIKRTDGSQGLAAIGYNGNTNYKYAQWGFFFGDMSTASGSREHVALGSFATGEKTAIRPGATGRVSYDGHLLGNVVTSTSTSTSTYTKAGTFKDVFDFGSRTGQVTAEFDSKTFKGVSSIGGAGGYQNNIADVNATSTAPGQFLGQMQGQFVGGQDAAGRPRGLVGAFQIDNAQDYVAVGTFAADGTPQ